MHQPSRKLISTVFVLVAAVIYVALHQKSFVRVAGRFPYIWTAAANWTIERYLMSNPTNDVLLVCGPYRSGKSRMIESIGDRVLSSIGFPVDIRADRARTIEELISSIKFEAASKLAVFASKLSQSQIHALSGASLSVEGRRATFANDGLAQAFHSIERAVDALLSDTPEQFFEMISVLNNVLPTYVLVHGLEQLLELKDINGKSVGAFIYERCLPVLLRRRQYADFVHVVVEIKDTSRVFDADRVGGFRLVFTDEIVDPVRQMESLSLFRQDEGRLLVKEFGGHFGSMEIVFEEIKMGTSLRTIINDLNTRLDTELAHLVATDDSAGYRSGMTESEANVSALVKRGYIFVNSSRSLTPAGDHIRRRLEKLVDHVTAVN